MKIIESISVSEDATLFSLSDSPADISFIAGIFEKIAEAGIDVDMISQFLPNSSHAGLSFTVSDAGLNQLGKVCEDYLRAQLERGFSSLDYWKKVKDIGWNNMKNP